MKKKIFTVPNPVFKCNVLFICGYTIKELEKELKKRKVTDFKSEDLEDATGSQLTFENAKGNKLRVLWVESFDTSIGSIGVAVHEIFHLVIRICDDKNVPIVRENCADETAAYLQDYYFRAYYSELTGKKNIPG